ncbi:MAG TPA: pilus assembly protein PilM [Candidatus Binatia bacterium]|nr:pilus assembly protein PilM [Candidatus Binatia bacterium]
MPQRILALDIEEAEVKAALLETSFRDYRIAGLYRDALTPGGSVSDQLRRFLDSHQLAGDTVVSTLPGRFVSHRVFFLPFRDRKRLNQTIPFELESQVPFGLDEVVVDYQVLRRDSSGTTVLAAMVQKTDLAAHLATLSAAGVDPKVVDFAPLTAINVLRVLGRDLPATLALVEFNDTNANVLLYRNRELVGLRSVSLVRSHATSNGSGGANNGHSDASSSQDSGDASARAAAIDIRWTLMVLNGAPLDDQLPCYLTGVSTWVDSVAPRLEHDAHLSLRRLDRRTLPSVPVEAAAALPMCTSPLGLALREVAPSTALGLNFRRAEFAYHRGQQEVRRALMRVGILAVVLVLLTIVNLFMAYQQQVNRLGAIDARIREVFKATLPDERPVNERAQLQAEIDKAEQRINLLGGIVSLSGVAAIDVARGISASIPVQSKIDIDEYSFDPEGVRIRAKTDAFETVDAIKQSLTPLPYFKDVQVKDVKAGPDGKDVTFRLLLLMTKDTHVGE